ncbi:hypothetical protein QQF64_001418 [Cirrhinus molitorella]|uniref:Uncharacterized protein n=1 Tax=Cirrhinus molitorella TaxID=172907 RepID=A0ABR3P005_9TELE
MRPLHSSVPGCHGDRLLSCHGNKSALSSLPITCFPTNYPTMHLLYEHSFYFTSDQPFVETWMPVSPNLSHLEEVRIPVLVSCILTEGLIHYFIRTLS